MSVGEFKNRKLGMQERKSTLTLCYLLMFLKDLGFFFKDIRIIFSKVTILPIKVVHSVAVYFLIM